jgi:hypothetical protein
MNCDKDNATYGSTLFCKSCGMDIGLSSVKIKRNQRIEYYCCIDCKELDWNKIRN